jgi:hypothetical protein
MEDLKGFVLFLTTLTPGQWTALGSALLGFYYVFCSTMAFVLGILGNRYPWAMRAATWFGDRGRRMQPAGNALGGAMPGGVPPQLAMARSIAPRPSLVDICPVCGSPAVLPHPANSQETHQ